MELTDDDPVLDPSALFLLVLVDDSCETGVCGVEGGEEGKEEAHHGVTEQQHQGDQPVLEKGVPVKNNMNNVKFSLNIMSFYLFFPVFSSALLEGLFFNT